jgi:hypothetical protein
MMMLSCGVVPSGAIKLAEKADNEKSLNNAKQITLALRNMAGNSPNGDIPPAWGNFPPGAGGPSKSFFFYMLPYIGEQQLYNNPKDAPVKTYIAPTDVRNPGNNATISYAANGVLLGIAPPTPHFPASFSGRVDGIIVVMERSGLNGAHKWNASTNTTTLGKPGSLPPFPQFGAEPSAYQDDSPQAFTSAGCVVGLGDGSARNITDNMGVAWKWACNPQDWGPPPAGW